MTLDRMNLDDVDYDDLVARAMTSIPTLYPGWTNENASDPGITLVELFAWLVDMVVYRTNRIPPASYQVFLRLLNGPTWAAVPSRELPGAIRSTMENLRKLYRAVTTRDYESLATGTFPTSAGAPPLEPIRRITCLGERDVTTASPTSDAPGHVSLVVASQLPEAPESPWSDPSGQLTTALANFFEDRRMITTTVHVTGPVWIPVAVSATLYLENDASPDAVRAAARQAVEDYFHPWTGGRDQAGWPFGQWIYASDVTVLLGAVPGVDCVEGVGLSATGASGDNRQRTDGEAKNTAAVVAIAIEPHELPKIAAVSVDLTLKVMRGAMAQSGTEWVEWTAEES
ncbi:MAG: baseplate J/gp47 family protein [Byssovorax sp.]